ncbi:MAG: Tfp pilus assembly protein FimT/FimU [Planctomycetota bacterium]
MNLTRHQRTFTLLEILLVVAVIGILAGLTVPRMSGSTKRHRLEAQARTMVGLARKARALAAGEGRTYVLLVDPAGRELRLVRQRDPLAEPDDAKDPELEVPADERWARPLSFEEDVTLDRALVEDEEQKLSGSGAEPLLVPFRPDGTSDAVQLDFRLGTDVIPILVDRNLGEARIQPATQVNQ